MTPGQEALTEAMRLEQARIYSRTCAEPVTVRPRSVTGSARLRGYALDHAIAHRFSRGRSIAAIALELGYPRNVIEATLARLAEAS